MKNYWYILSGLLFLAIIIGIIVFESKGNYYKVSTEEIYKATLNSEIALNTEALNNQSKSILLVDLSEDKEEDESLTSEINILNIKPSDLLKPANRKLFKNHSGLIVLQSDNKAIATKAWVLLSRVGFSNIKIRSEEVGESLKYTFQPDTLPD